MNPHPRTAVNRTALGAVGLALLLAGTWLASDNGALVPRLPSWWPTAAPGSVLLDRGELARLRAEDWWTPTVTGAAAALTVLFAWCALAQLRSGATRRLAVAAPGATVRPQALAEALSARTTSVPGVARCRARVLPRGRERLEVGLRVWLDDDTPPEAVLAGLSVVAREAERAVAPDRKSVV